MRYPAAAIDARQIKAPVTELIHDLDRVLCHGAEAVVDVIGPGLRQGTVAVATQIRQDHMVTLCKPRRDAMPRDMILRIAMQQKQWWPRTAMAKPDDRTAGGHVQVLEAREV